MDLIDQLKTLASNVAKLRDSVQTEEATKNAFVMPFITALGYNVFDPTEVVPEFTADVGIKKGEKVDYAILKEGKPIILFECKHCKTELNEDNMSQLLRYFNVTEARFGMLTNGIIYRFYTDLDESNKMDAKPFLEFNILDDIKDSLVDDLKRFTKGVFNLDDTLVAATELKYTKEIKRIIAEQLANPTEDFIKLFASKVYSGKLTTLVKQQFADLVKKALAQFINERINERLKRAAEVPNEPTEPPVSSPLPVSEEDGKKNKIVTTEEEIEGYHIVKAILRQTIDVNRIIMRDTINYCGILLDDNNRKPICRLYFNVSKKKSLGLFDDPANRDDKVSITELNDIYKYSERLISTVKYYLEKPVKEE